MKIKIARIKTTTITTNIIGKLIIKNKIQLKKKEETKDTATGISRVTLTPARKPRTLLIKK